ncbi:hypothetical protein [Paraburkholderia sp.]|uniref:hypothetical protein n=1 Tax=Paraburkholderia sp. TaxID=1926495 RepID=UPI003D6DEE1A
MKPVSLLLRGIVVSSVAIAVVVAAQESPQKHWAQSGRAATVEAAQRANGQRKEFTPPAPRGDLRGDIASNVRVRPEPQARENRDNRNNDPRRR